MNNVFFFVSSLVVGRGNCVGGGLLHRPLALGQHAGTEPLVLEESVVAVDGHANEGEEAGGPERRALHVLGGVDGGVQPGCEEEERHEGAEDGFDQQPGDDVELLGDVEEVEEEQDPRRPEAGHGHERVPASRRGRAPVDWGTHYADEPDQVHDLEIRNKYK